MAGDDGELRRPDRHRRHQDHRPLLTFAVAVGYAALALTLLALLLEGRQRRLSGTCVTAESTCTTGRACGTLPTYLNEGALDPAGTRSASKFSDWPRTSPRPTAYARTIVLIEVALALVAVAAMFLRQIFGQSTTYSWLVGRLFMPIHLQPKFPPASAGEPLTNVRFSGSSRFVGSGAVRHRVVSVIDWGRAPVSWVFFRHPGQGTRSHG